MLHQNRTFCAGLMRAETVSRIGDPEGIFTGRGIRDVPERAWPRICKVPGEGSAYRAGSHEPPAIEGHPGRDSGAWFWTSRRILTFRFGTSAGLG